MPGFELYDHYESDAVKEVFSEGGILFAHGFDSLRKRYHVREFENLISQYFGSPYTNAVSSGTAAIKCALKALGVSAGDEVITQSFNFIATVEAIVDCGAVPIIADVNDNLHICPDSVASLITNKTAAVIPVHMLGMCGDVSKILEVARSHNIPVLEDNCESVGASYKGKYLGTIGDIGVFSFDHGKMIATGEGGCVLTRQVEHHKYVSSYSDHGHALLDGVPRGSDNAIMPGFNYRMTELQAAVGKVQLAKLTYMLNENKLRYEALYARLSQSFSIRLSHPESVPTYDTLMFQPGSSEQLENCINILKKRDLGTKNIPDSMKWHCSYYWNHVLDNTNLSRSYKTQAALSKYVAIPILLKKDVEFYDQLATELAA
ncbi:aminotransferase [Cylindrospermopsis raciborskii S07]|uniref:DegT/DnrJ/EryC1/StrS family aminotransferase n=1 Tax=Cylindrospermopsis raciborskii TaxID=77022 RepID=UPI000C9E97AA|nr:DegT/DnrJ/EryC1/StrS family aminotransferase [Cylindrospermopsis raciborskii]PNK05099.1 aminotransferase [Cylindrospermopsis raciborskii S14]PNK06727.1 aminotransferase [Cylindrospermopsis raciborskii S10]PNK10796.1 aminotransferase [Cylindrospermopsis raciborskii S07]PNK15355.1 aminotransferase [Cylindrospermopsis raciborskii S06]PNK16878.1 aminotransferase [Cylindrospermopsis raciborskii S05]